ncbi:hypothetical protein ACFWY6_33775 [Streptomyces sp. NPDC059037]|uniref:hypothetical protein n=1 Tax=Streptomyces sp. NPDC059037 TaxID=3346710 RepID=UPI00369F6BA0
MSGHLLKQSVVRLRDLDFLVEEGGKERGAESAEIAELQIQVFYCERDSITVLNVLGLILK